MKNTLKKIFEYFKKDIMLTVSIVAAIISLFISPPSGKLIKDIDWKTLCTLFMLLGVLEGFKQENLFKPIIRLSKRFGTQLGLSFFLVFGVFISSMFVTNDVSLIIFVPLTIILFRASDKENYLLPIIVMENIAAVRGSLLTPFGSPQNLFLYSKSNMNAGSFLLMMLPIWIMSIVLISVFLLFIYRKNPKEKIVPYDFDGGEWKKENKYKRIIYLTLFCIIILSIVTRTSLWPYITVIVALVLIIFDRKIYTKVDFALLGTFLCFFVFSSSISSNEAIASYLSSKVAGNEYWWSIALSQFISNVPASIVLWPFTENLRALIYGLDSAGLVFIIGSLASVIAMRIYLKEYPGKGKDFLKTFEIISLAFFLIIVLPQLLII